MSTVPRREEDTVHFQDVVEHLPLVPYVDRLDEISTAVYIGPQIEELTGYSWDDFRNDQELFLRLVHPDDRGLYLSLVTRRNRESVPASGEYRLVRRDGRVVWVQDHERLVEDASGSPVVAQGYLLDVTERRSHGVRLEAINAVLAAFSAGVSGDELVRAGLDALADALPGLRISYVALDRGGNLRLIQSAGGSGLQPIEHTFLTADEVPDYLEPLRRGEALSSEDGSRADTFGAVFAELGGGFVESFLDVPIRHAGRLVAILCTDSALPRRFAADERQTLREVGRQLVVALEREGAEADLRRRDEILSAVSRGAAVVLAGSTWEDAAPGLLESLGRAVAASRAYIFQLDPAVADAGAASQRFEWTAEAISSQRGNPQLKRLVFAHHHLDDLARALRHGEVLPMIVRDLPGRAKALMESQSIRSLVTVPIVVGGLPWGFVGFDDCEQERDWSAPETEALRAAASLIGAAITREHNEAAVREHETKVRAVFDASFDGIFLTDDDRRLVDLNDEAAAMFGLPREAMVGRRIDDLLESAPRGAVDSGWAAFLGGDAVTGEYELSSDDGATRQLEYSARPSFLPGLSIAFVRDVTERRRLETRLRAAQRLEGMGRVAGGVAHDFNNLLTAISGYTSLALERLEGDSELSGDLTEIQRAADRAGELTRQLLAFGRRQVLTPQPLQLAHVLDGVEAMLRRLVGDVVRLQLRHDPATPTVLADAGQLEQVAVNLAINAREAMPDGGTLTIATYPTERDGTTYAALEVADTGVGMDAHTRSRAFEPFFTTRREGVGLGLASVYGIVTQSEGAIELTSEPGRGTTFTVLLPTTNAAVVQPRSETKGEPDPDTGTETVLLVEDEDVVRALARRVLEQHGYRVLESRNGHEAIGIAETYEGDIDVLLTDVVMPGLRGHEVADRIAATRPGIAVVYMSGYADEALLGRAAEGGSHFLEKPFSNAALARKLREALGAGGS